MHILLVVGSVNMDIVNRVNRLPQAGETVHGKGTGYHPGGKGANQAAAAARAGGSVAMLGAVGDDAFGGQLAASLAGSGVRTDLLFRKEGNTGMAFITVDDTGENTIILSPGANGKLAPDDVRKGLAGLEQPVSVLLQNEIPWETTRYALAEAKSRGFRTLFNPAPALPVTDDTLSLTDVLIVNVTEAETLSGIPAAEPRRAEEAAERLIRRGAGAVIVTLGKEGAYYRDKSGTALHIPAYRVTPVDTTGAGDTFIGAYAAESAAGRPAADALRFAAAAAALSVTRHGAQSSVPTREEIVRFMEIDEPRRE